MRLLLTFTGTAVAACGLTLSAWPAFSGDTASVPMKVAVAAPCITVSVKDPSGTLDFGTKILIPASGSQSYPAVADDSSADAFYTNCASAGETFYVKGTDASSGGASPATWALTDLSGQSGRNPCPLGPNKYGTTVQTWTSGGSLSPSVSSVELSNANQQLRTTPSGGGTYSARHELWMPCTGSDGLGQTLSSTVTYTATF